MDAIPEKSNPRLPTVLIVEDNQMVTRALATLLQREGYRPAVFHSGEEALSFAGETTLSAAVIDIHLPDINGLILSKKLRERLGPGVPIIVLSGDASMENIKSLPHVGADYFISKPVNSTHLIEQLNEMVMQK